MKCEVLCTMLCFLTVGCATEPIIGPFSRIASESNKKALIRRSAMASEMQPETKAKIFQATAFTSNPSEISVGLGVDVLTLMSGKYTWKEVFKQVLGVGGDLALYTAIGYAVTEANDNNSGSERNGHNVTVRGDNNNVNVTQGDSNDNTSSENRNSSGGTSNQDIEPNP